MVKKSSTVRGSGQAQKSLVSRIIEILSPLSVTPKRAENIEMNNLRRGAKNHRRPTNPQVDFHSKVPCSPGPLMSRVLYFWGFAVVKCKSEEDEDMP